MRPLNPQIKFPHILMHRPNQDLQNLKFSWLHLFPFAHIVVPQFVPHFRPFSTYFDASAASRSTKPEIFMSLSLSVLSQSGPPKSVGWGVGLGQVGFFKPE